ncbi:structural maintenance of chromosomes protein 6A-like isoform X2 [Wolffia australiana]
MGSEADPATRKAGIISKIRLENFMCHSSLQIEFGDWVNFITGQNGSGKSAILTSLCVAFGCRARDTQRASSVKDFIKTGCSYAVVIVEIKNQGVDAFKPDLYGEMIIVERRITDSSSSIILKDHKGKKVAQRKIELRELVEHFNIDVENPCVIMSQDKSREFLHSGSEKDKFKFFFKATLLLQVSELLQHIKNQLDAANSVVEELESLIRPVQKELDELLDKIKNMEHIEEIDLQRQILIKKLAWSLVYDVDKQIHDHGSRLEKLKDRVPACQAKIDRQLAKQEELNRLLQTKKMEISSLMEKTSEVRKMQDELQEKLSVAAKEMFELQEEETWGRNSIKKMIKHVELLEHQVHEFHEQYVKDSQVKDGEIESEIRSLQAEVDTVSSSIQRLQEKENKLLEDLLSMKNSARDTLMEIEEYERQHRALQREISELKQCQTNKVTAFGGERVLRLLQAIERNKKKFKKAPIGPIGAHVTLSNGGVWSLAVETAIGRLLDAFVVTNHGDSLILRSCAKEANYSNVQIIIYDFSRPRLHIPDNMVPRTGHPTILSVLHSDRATIINALVDMGSIERQVLVKDYDTGRSVAFEQRPQNLKDIFTSDGFRMFSRGPVQTILPPNKRVRAGRLCNSVGDQISKLEKEAMNLEENIQHGRGRKRDFDAQVQGAERELQSIKRQCLETERSITSKRLALQDLKNGLAAERTVDPLTDASELQQEISRLRLQVQEKETLLQEVERKRESAEDKANSLNLSHENLRESVKEEILAIEEAEKDLLIIEEEMQSAEREKTHYERIMDEKVLSDIKEAESLSQKLHLERQENFEKASKICSETEMESVGGCSEVNSEQLSIQLKRIDRQLRQEKQRFTESIDDLRETYHKKEQKILKKKQTYQAFREKLEACQKALDIRWNKFNRNAALLKRQLTWQ